ncbi:MAG: 5-formyltetrahydrofolate cyclo-ligase [Elusimicrobiota bacterium]
MTQKKQIRKKIIKIRKSATNKTVASNSHKILKKLFQIKEFCQAKKVMFYSSFNNEIDTHRMIKKSLKLKKEVFLPKVVKNQIVPVRIKSFCDLVLGKFGIFEPKTENRKPKKT